SRRRAERRASRLRGRRLRCRGLGAGFADHQEAAGPAAGDSPAPGDLAAIGVEPAFVLHAVHAVIAFVPAVIELEEGDGAGVTAALQRGAELDALRRAMSAGLFGGAAERRLLLAQMRDKGHRPAVAWIGIDAV